MKAVKGKRTKESNGFLHGIRKMNMKKLFLALCVLTAVLVEAAPKVNKLERRSPSMTKLFTGTWTACLNDDLTPEMVRTNTLGSIQTTPILPDENGHIDFSLIRKDIPEKSRAAAFYEYDSPYEQEITFGLFADWWFAVYLNGKPICDCIKESNGEVHSIYGRKLQCTLKKGKNIFAVYLLAGSDGCSFDIGLLPQKIKFDEAGLPDLVKYFYTAPRELYSLPWLSEPGKDSITVKFAAQDLCSAAIQYQPTNGGDILTMENAAWGQRIVSKFHQFKLTGLKPGTKYQYTILLRWKDNGNQVQKIGSFSFKTFAENMADHTLTITADTQTKPVDMKKCFQNFSQKGLFRGGDLFVHLGDVQSSYTHFLNAFAETFLKTVQPYANAEVPVEIIRGNHEFRGGESLSFAEVAGNPYRAFVIGDVFYLKLDTGWDVDASKDWLDWRDLTEDYMRGQKAWLEKTVVSEEWKKARWHVVLAHATPCYDFSPFVTRNVQMLIGDLFLGKNPRVKIDLWLCGHTHLAARFDVETQKYLTFEPRRHSFFFDEKKKYMIRKLERGCSMDYITLPFEYVPFPFAVMDGPEKGAKHFSAMRLTASAHGINVKHFHASGDLMDEFSITPQGFKVISTKMRPIAEQQAKIK